MRKQKNIEEIIMSRILESRKIWDVFIDNEM